MKQRWAVHAFRMNERRPDLDNDGSQHPRGLAREHDEGNGAPINLRRRHPGSAGGDDSACVAAPLGDKLGVGAAGRNEDVDVAQRNAHKHSIVDRAV